MAKKGQTFKRYSEEFKLRAVNMYQQGEMGYNAIPICIWGEGMENNSLYDHKRTA